jgi:hypothetical protein
MVPALATGLAAAVLLSAGSAAAHGTVFPYHERGAVICDAGGIMRVYPPRVMAPTQPTDFRNPEQVYWSPDLYRKQGRSWRRVVSGPILYAFTSSYGYYQATLQAAWHLVDNPGSQILFHRFTGLGPGLYRVKSYLWWDWGADRWHRQRQGRCLFY